MSGTERSGAVKGCEVHLAFDERTLQNLRLHDRCRALGGADSAVSFTHHRSCSSLREALENLDKDRAFLKVGGVFDDDFIDSYMELKMAEIIRFEHTPHPVEFEMYYSA